MQSTYYETRRWWSNERASPRSPEALQVLVDVEVAGKAVNEIMYNMSISACTQSHQWSAALGLLEAIRTRSPRLSARIRSSSRDRSEGVGARQRRFRSCQGFRWETSGGQL